jgi:coproporphyrinogen III oxidase
MTVVDRAPIEEWYRRLQDELCTAFEELDGSARFRADRWERDGGGGGETRVIEDGDTLEKAAVNVSAVWGETPARLSESMAFAGSSFYATGISVIAHPRNPHAPTFHANLRYFESGESRWFGGGSDLTPHYLYDEDAGHFHRVLRDVCERHPIADYAAWKAECDRYFFLPHRGEARGVGGVFFDHLTERLDEVWAFQRELGEHLPEAYLPIVERRRQTPYGLDERRWQELRRGRYAEFNLIWDRGTRFGIETGGRTESILASLPPTARWEYVVEPDPGTAEAGLLSLLTSPAVDWAEGER